MTESGSLIIHDGVLKNNLFSMFFNFERILTEILFIDGHFLWLDMIEHPFLSIPAKTACPGRLRLIFSKISRATHLAEFWSGLLPLIPTISALMFFMSQGSQTMHAKADYPSLCLILMIQLKGFRFNRFCRFNRLPGH